MEQNQQKIKALETQLKEKEQNLAILQQAIQLKEQTLLIKEQQLTEQTQLSDKEKIALQAEIEQLKQTLEQEKINFEVQLNLKNDQIKNLETQHAQLTETLQNSKEETANLRAQHEATLKEIQNQIIHYQQLVNDLEKETTALKEQMAQNQTKATELQKQLISKQEHLSGCNLNLGYLKQQEKDLKVEIAALQQKYDEWLAQCEIKKCYLINAKYYGVDTNVRKTIEDHQTYYSPVPFKVSVEIRLKYKALPDDDLSGEQMREFKNLQPWHNENKNIIFSSEKTQVNGQDVYYIRFNFFNDRIVKTTNTGDLLESKEALAGYDIHRCYIESKDQSLSLTPPPQIMNKNLFQFLEDKKQELLTLQSTIHQYNQMIIKAKEELNTLIAKKISDPTLEDEIKNKENHIQKLKTELALLTSKEQSFQTRIYSLETENKNLKAKYDQDLQKVTAELEATKKENQQLEQEMKNLKTEIANNGQANQTLIVMLKTKQEKVKELKTKIYTLEENETKLKAIIQSKDEEINQLEAQVTAQAEEITRLNTEIEKQLQLYMEQSQKIQQLEGIIKGLEEANAALGNTNETLLLKIEELKKQLADEETAHEKTKKELEHQKNEREEREKTFGKTKDEFKKMEAQWDNLHKRSHFIDGGAFVGSWFGPGGYAIGTMLGSSAHRLHENIQKTFN